MTSFERQNTISEGGAAAPEAGARERYSYEVIENAWQPEHFSLNGARVELYGLAHTPETMEVFGPEIEDAVKRASVVLLESAPSATGIASNETIAEIERFMVWAGRPLSREEAARMVQDNPGIQFFSELEALAAKYGKPVAVADPTESRGSGFENVTAMYRLEAVDENATRARLLAMLGGAGALIAPEIMARLRERAPGPDERSSEPRAAAPRERTRSPIARRRFLQLLGGAALAVAGASEQASHLRSTGRYAGRGENPFGTFLYDGNDYRDVSVAEGLDRLTARAERGGPVAVFYGNGHSKAIRHYAEAPVERRAKSAAYEPYRRVMPPRLRIFRKESGAGWRAVREEAL